MHAFFTPTGLQLDLDTLTLEESLQVCEQFKLFFTGKRRDDSLHDGTGGDILDLEISQDTSTRLLPAHDPPG